MTSICSCSGVHSSSSLCFCLSPWYYFTSSYSSHSYFPSVPNLLPAFCSFLSHPNLSPLTLLISSFFSFQVVSSFCIKTETFQSVDFTFFTVVQNCESMWENRWNCAFTVYLDGIFLDEWKSYTDIYFSQLNVNSLFFLNVSSHADWVQWLSSFKTNDNILIARCVNLSEWQNSNLR